MPGSRPGRVPVKQAPPRPTGLNRCPVWHFGDDSLSPAGPGPGSRKGRCKVPGLPGLALPSAGHRVPPALHAHSTQRGLCSAFSLCSESSPGRCTNTQAGARRSLNACFLQAWAPGPSDGAWSPPRLGLAQAQARLDCSATLPSPWPSCTATSLGSQEPSDSGRVPGSHCQFCLPRDEISRWMGEGMNRGPTVRLMQMEAEIKSSSS